MRTSGPLVVALAVLVCIALFTAIGILARPHWTEGPAAWDAYHAKLRVIALMFCAFWAGIVTHYAWSFPR